MPQNNKKENKNFSGGDEAKKSREEKIRQHKEERKAENRRLLGKTILLLVLCICLIVVLTMVQNQEKGRPLLYSFTKKATASTAAGGDAVTESVGEESEHSLSTSYADSSAPVYSEPVSVPEASSKEEALTEASAYATQYDYDKAIAVLDPYSSDSDAAEAIQKYTSEKEACVAVDVTKVPHVFFHSLINDDRGLRSDVVGQDRAWRNDAAMATADEFDHMIEDMYEAGYVLVGLDDLCVKTTGSDGTVQIAKNTHLMLPEGKKALVFSEDDLSYYHTYGIGTQGYATKMVLDDKGEVKCEYTDEHGKTKIGDYDVVPRLDTFIEKHPDFSYHGARGTVAMTGYNGVFGYRTNDYYKDINNPNLSKDQVQWLKDHPDFSWEQDVKDATAIADAMKKEGWTFASHTYGHLNATEKGLDTLKKDNERWMKVNHDILGDTDKIIFAFGGDIGGVHQYTSDNAKFEYFKSQGYNIFCNVDGNIGWTEFGDNYMRTGRVALDGFTMYQAMTEDGKSHTTYAHDYEVLGITGVRDWFNQYRITPIEGE